MPQGGSFLLYEGKEGDPFWTSATRSLAVKSQRTNNKIPLFG
jgi:type IV secretion system protein VirD4